MASNYFTDNNLSNTQIKMLPSHQSTTSINFDQDRISKNFTDQIKDGQDDRITMYGGKYANELHGIQKKQRRKQALCNMYYGIIELVIICCSVIFLTALIPDNFSI